jgi:ATP-binding cassette subfamily F protein 3
VSLLRLTDVERFYGAEKVFGPLSVTIQPGDKIGLIGRNGVGKTTLLRLLAGIDPLDRGGRVVARQVNIGFMQQDVRAAEQRTLWEYVSTAKEDAARLGKRIGELEEQMAAPHVQADEELLQNILNEYARVRARFEAVGGYGSDAAIKATLFGLGFKESELETAYQALSGGQKARAALAHLLLTSPDLLLLDEPTNHLDTDAVEWLENYLRDYRGALVAVSHDRVFLDKIVTRIWELEGEQLLTYNGNYTTSRSLRKEQRDRRQKEYEAQQKEIAALEAYVRRYMEGNRSTMAKSRLKALQRMERVQRPITEADAMRLRLTSGPRSGKEVLLLDAVSHDFSGHQVLCGIDALVYRGSRIGIVGANGSGKTTLLKIIAGLLEPAAGRVRYGKDVVIGYFSQELDDLEPENTVLDELLTARHMNLFAARSHLARYMFQGDDVYKQVKVLSGGERNRLALAKLVLTEANLLLLDEPTNHLDIPGREALEEALQDYDGTLIFVSHDRYFLSSLAQHIWYLRAGKLDAFVGSYAQWRETQTPAAQMEQTEPSAGKTRYERQRAAELQKRARERERKKLTERLHELEERINAVETEKERLEALLADTQLYTDGEKAKRTTQAHRRILAELEALYAEWETVAVAQAESGN